MICVHLFCLSFFSPCFSRFAFSSSFFFFQCSFLLISGCYLYFFKPKAFYLVDLIALTLELQDHQVTLWMLNNLLLTSSSEGVSILVIYYICNGVLCNFKKMDATFDLS